MARILFITTKQPSTNPRMRKSADALAGDGHTVHVLYAYNTKWADEADEEILNGSHWSSERIGGHPDNVPLLFHATRIARKIYETVGNVKRGLCRGYGGYIRRGSRWKPDLIIGHNPGALGPLSTLGSLLNVPVLFDAEDFHRGETSPGSISSKIVSRLENDILPQLRTITAASPLIAKAYKILYPNLEIHAINNAFPVKYLHKEPTRNESNLSVAWFSQVVGLDRGLEEFLNSLKFLKDLELSIHIIGLCSPEVKQCIKTKVLLHCHQIRFSPP